MGRLIQTLLRMHLLLDRRLRKLAHRLMRTPMLTVSLNIPHIRSVPRMCGISSRTSIHTRRLLYVTRPLGPKHLHSVVVQTLLLWLVRSTSFLILKALFSRNPMSIKRSSPKMATSLGLLSVLRQRPTLSYFALPVNALSRDRPA
jgi:hypothetical protein